MCRHLAWLGAPRSVAVAGARPAVRAAAPVLRAAPAEARRWSTPTAGASASSTRPATGAPLALGPAAVGRRLVRLDRAGAAVGRGAGRGALGDGRACRWTRAAAAPFTDGRWLLSHNGRVVARGAARRRATAESMCDSALLAAHVFARGRRRHVVDTIARGRRARPRRVPVGAADRRRAHPRRHLGRRAELPRRTRRRRRGQRAVGRRPALGRRPRPPPHRGDPRPASP